MFYERRPAPDANREGETKTTMNRLSNEQIMDYLDGTLGAAERAQIESHLERNAEDAATVRELQFALSATQDFREADQLRVSENFWPGLRDNLGPCPKRSWWSNLLKGAAPQAAPKAKWGLGAAFAAIALALAMGAMMWAPQNASTPAVAITDADQAFIQQSAAKHEAYVTSQAVPGDTSARETGADEDNLEDAIP